MLARTFFLALAGGALLGACSKTEPPPPKAQARVQAPAPTPSSKVPDASKEIDEGLKERLARQEAAAKMFEKNVLSPPPPRAPAPPAAEKAAAPAAAPDVAPSPAPARPQPATPEPPKVAARTELPKAAAVPATSAPSASAPSSPSPASPAPAQQPPPRTDVAAARPAPAPDAAAIRLVTRVDPDFPREAVQAGVEQGNVKARLTLDAGGNVTRVEIVDSNPRRVFDRAVVRALSQWRYNDGAAGRTVEMEVAFKR